MNFYALCNYEKFSDEAKHYINKVIEIFSAIESKKIEKDVKMLDNKKKPYSFCRFDKKIVSLYIAAFLAEGRLKNILKEYDDIKINKLLSFIEIDEKDIVPLEPTLYKKIYSDEFMAFLSALFFDKEGTLIFNEINPLVIFSLLNEIKILGSEILNYLARDCGINKSWLADHPSFKVVRNIALGERSIEKVSVKGFENSSIFSGGSLRNDLKPRTIFSGKGLGSSNLYKNSNQNLESTYIYKNNNKINDNNFSNNNNQAIDYNSDEIWGILDEIQNKFIAQEQAVEDIFNNIINNLQLSLKEDVIEGERSVIFLDGPTGTGKTAIVKDIAKKMKVPFVATSATDYSAAGYKGGDITDILKSLLDQAKGDTNLAQRGIVVLDEFDKIMYSTDGDLKMKKAVQQQLLNFTGGGSYNIPIGSPLFNISTTFDTSKLTFVCLGALTDLRERKMQVKRTIGFRKDKDEQINNITYSITPQDLIDLGLERELVGRLNAYIHTEEYSKEDLLKIFRTSSISPLVGFNNLVTSKGKELVIDEDTYDLIIEAAYELNTGARSLQTVMNSIRTRLFGMIMRGKEKTIYLDSDTVKNIIDNINVRKCKR